MRLLHEYIQSLDLDYDYKKVKEIYDFIEQNIKRKNGNTISLAAAKWLYVDDKTIEIIPKGNSAEKNRFKEIEINEIGEYPVNGKTLIIKKYIQKDIFVFPESTANFVYVDLSKIQFPLTIRTRKDGDIISPFGMTGTMKLKKYFNSKGVNRHTRDDIILLTKDNEVLWAAGVGLSSKVSVNEVPTHVIELK
jgi:tRNA(Ile)-lysidine synthase